MNSFTLARKALCFFLFSLCLILPASAAIDIENLLGRYETATPTNDWHRGTLSRRISVPSQLRWTNDAGVSWILTPDVENGLLITGADYPYTATSPNMPLHFLGAAGASAVDFFQINGETYSRKFTIRNDYPNNTTNSNHLIRGPFVVWWETGQNSQAVAADFLAWAEVARNDLWASGLLDMTSIGCDRCVM